MTRRIVTALIVVVCVAAGGGYVFGRTDRARTVPAALSFFTGSSQFQSPVTAIMAWVLFSEPISWAMLLGIVVTATGVALVVRPPLKQLETK